MQNASAPGSVARWQTGGGNETFLSGPRSDGGFLMAGGRGRSRFHGMPGRTLDEIHYPAYQSLLDPGWNVYMILEILVVMERIGVAG